MQSLKTSTGVGERGSGHDSEMQRGVRCSRRQWAGSGPWLMQAAPARDVKQSGSGRGVQLVRLHMG
jgi:hypothetical protein